MSETLEEQVQKLLAGMDEQNEQEPEQGTQTPPPDGIQDIYVLIVREQEEPPDNSQVVDSTPASVPTQQDTFLSSYLFVCFSLFLIVSTLAFQFYCIVNPPTATINIIPKSQQVTLNGTLQLGRLLNAITISQSQTTPTTGKGHQTAKQAQGSITLYNGQFQSVFMAAGTILTGANNIQIITDQDASIPAGNPPNYGQVTISAHAINAGVRGNIPAYDINQACCATSVLAKNASAFYGGQDERTFTTVTQKDIHSVSTVLKTTLIQSVTGALQGQVKSNEQLQLLPCTPTVSSDQQPGQEATQVKVTVSQTCSAVAYSGQELAEKAAELLSTQALQKLGSGYSLFGNVQVSVKDATVTHTTTPLVFLSFQAFGTWIYALSQQSQQQIKRMIAGKTTQEAMQLLQLLPGVKQVSIRFTGFGDDTRLPKRIGYIHVILIVV